MDDEQQAEYADAYGAGNFRDGRWSYRAKDIVDSVRSYVLAEVAESAAFAEGSAAVTIKER
jgi:hypothetical protein